MKQSDYIAEFIPSRWQRLRSFIWLLFVGLLSFIFLISTFGSFPGAIDQSTQQALINRIIMVVLFIGSVVVLRALVLQLLVVSIRIDKRDIIYRSIRKELQIKIDDITTYRLMGRYTSGISMTFKLWHPKGSLLITNHEFSTDQVLAMAEIIDCSFKLHKENTSSNLK